MYVLIIQTIGKIIVGNTLQPLILYHVVPCDLGHNIPQDHYIDTHHKNLKSGADYNHFALRKKKYKIQGTAHYIRSFAV